MELKDLRPTPLSNGVFLAHGTEFILPFAGIIEGAARNSGMN